MGISGTLGSAWRGPFRKPSSPILVVDGRAVSAQPCVRHCLPSDLQLLTQFFKAGAWVCLSFPNGWDCIVQRGRRKQVEVYLGVCGGGIPWASFLRDKRHLGGHSCCLLPPRSWRLSWGHGALTHATVRVSGSLRAGGDPAGRRGIGCRATSGLLLQACPSARGRSMWKESSVGCAETGRREPALNSWLFFFFKYNSCNF